MSRKGSDIFSVSARYFKHLIRSGHRNGHRIHSPFAYDLVSKAIYGGVNTVEPDQANKYRESLLHMGEELIIEDPGAGSRVTMRNHRSIRSLAKHSSVTKRQGALLFRLARWYVPSTIIELGTNVGVSTAYLAEGIPSADLVSIEADESRYKFTGTNFPLDLRSNLKFIHANFDDVLIGILKKCRAPVLIFIDGDHNRSNTVRRVDEILKYCRSDDLMIIVDDIRWSKGMSLAWNEIQKQRSVSLSVELFKMGILVKRNGMITQHYKVRF